MVSFLKEELLYAFLDQFYLFEGGLATLGKLLFFQARKDHLEAFLFSQTQF
jgi:hypothetical protein